MIDFISEKLGEAIKSVEPISGGDINEARLLRTASSNFFLKFNTNPNALDMFQKEAKGLEQLRKPNCIKTPEVLLVDQHSDCAFLLLEYIEPAQKTNKFWETFGRELATLHQVSQQDFGLDHDNYIGSLEQANNAHKTWAEFYINERLEPQVQLAKNLLPKSTTNGLEKLYKQIPNLCPCEVPALSHGDLWSGNFLCTEKEMPVLIDPSVSFAHREMDLAMTHLFGGFAPEFYQAYQNVFPLKKGFAERMEIYQLYYLLVHVNLFGGNYIASVNRLVERFV